MPLKELRTICKYKGYTINVYDQMEPRNPREDCNLGNMICFHGRCSYGDRHKFSVEDCKRMEKSKDFISLPIYLYDHSGQTVRTTPFSCPWDSGQLGIITISKEDARKEYGKLTKKTMETILSVLKAEVEEYDAYLRGDCIGFEIINDKNGCAVESCWEMFGTEEDDAIEEAKSSIDGMIEYNKVKLK